jgi:Predicted Fe-S oxidoreductases
MERNMNKFYAKYLNIEVTRRCNMKCKHCLRGDAQDVDIDFRYIDNLLKHFQSVQYLGITGGEPSMNPKAIAYILDTCKKYDIHVNRFDIVTNGSETSMSDEFIAVCKDLYDYQENDESSDHDHMLELSDDKYHNKKLHPQVKAKLSPYPFFGVRGQSKDIFLLKQGRCTEGYEMPVFRIYLNDCDYVYGDIYLNAKGNILNDCNFSYDNQDNLSLCSAENFLEYIYTTLRTE